MSKPSDFEGLAAQLEQHLTEYHQHQLNYAQRNRELDARTQGIDVKHAELHRYVGKLVEFEQQLDRKLERGTRAVEGLAISFGKQLDALDDLKLDFKMMKTVIGKMAKKMGVL